MAKLSVLLAAALCLAGAEAQRLWPVPAKYEHGNSTLWLSPNVQPQIRVPQGNAYGNDGSALKKLTNAWRQTHKDTFERNIVPWKFNPKGSNFEPPYDRSGEIQHIVITQHKEDVDRPTYDELDESYKIVITDSNPADGKEPRAIYLDAPNSHGIIHGLTTLSQLFYESQTSGQGCVYSKVAPVTIDDKPKYKHRGVNLDVSRQWYPVSTILKTIEAMSWNKLNRLHLHATDSQSWPLEIPSMPGLAKNGAYAKGLTYSPADLQTILDFAAARAVEVIVEIDMPGHTTSIAETYPELIVGRNIQPNWDKYAAQPPSGSLRLNNPAVETFLTKLFKDLLPRLNKHSAYFHSGGDEVNKNVYALDEGVGSAELAAIRPHLQKFFSHVQTQVKTHKMTTIVWEEMLLEWGLQVPKGTIIQTWQTDEAAQNATAKGYQIIGGNYNYWYLDCGQGQWLDFGPAVFKQFYPFADYCSPRKNWRLVYSYDPAQGLSEAQAKLVLGGEVHIWSEQIDTASLDVMLWPRGSAAAEVLWSGRTTPDGKNRTFADASPRLGIMRERMVKRGVNASPVMQLWCHQNEGDCALN
ncbi:glycoside hydrolase superfamily [Geopyxis carbonaria]|nr:glycoside hydrolase superfamily [Geopyxis carbonaria]